MAKIMKKILTAVLSLAMVACFVPQMNAPAYAEDSGTPAIQLVQNGTAPNIPGGQGGSTEGGVWFGNYKQSSDGNGGFLVEPVKWRVLANADGKLFLLSDKCLDSQIYGPYNDEMTWETSTIRAWLNGLIYQGDSTFVDNNFIDSAFSDKEQAAIAMTSVKNKTTSEYNPNPLAWIPVDGNDTEDQIFLLCAGESMNAAYGFKDENDPTPTREAESTDYANNEHLPNFWWLRSRDVEGASSSLLVYPTGNIGGNYQGTTLGVRPAFNLDLSSVLFTSAPSASDGGKVSGDVGANALTTVSAYSGSEWKVTLQSGHADFELSSCTPTESGVEVKYTGATVGTEDKPEYISAVITDKPITEGGAAIKYYGRVKSCTSASDSVTINTAEKLGSGDTLYVFNEQCNGDKKTDYASALQEVTIQKPKLTITAKDQTYEYNGQTQGEGDTVYADPAQIAEKVTVEGLQADDELTSIVVDGQGTDVGKYDLVPSNATINEKPASDKYDVAYVNGTLTIEEPTPVTYTVTFVDGQGKTLKTEKVESGKAATAPATPKRSGYTFTGWDKDFSKVTRDLTVTAKWKKNAAKVGGTLLSKMTAKGKNSLVLTWSKVKGAEGYDIFFIKCVRQSPKKVKTIKGNKTFKWTKKGLKTKKAYKAVVKAYVTKNGKKTYIRTSPMVHAYTSGGTSKYTNAKSVTVKKTSVSLKAGKTYKIKANVVKLQKGKKLMPTGHAPKLRYVSSNKKIATVSRSGKITAKSKGSCKVYVIAVNGASKAVSVTVK